MLIIVLNANKHRKGSKVEAAEEGKYDLWLELDQIASNGQLELVIVFEMSWG